MHSGDVYVEASWPNSQRTRLQMERSVFGPWPGTLCCVLGHFTLALPLSPRVYKKVLANLMLGDNPATGHYLTHGGVKYSCLFMLQNPEINEGLMRHLARIQT